MSTPRERQVQRALAESSTPREAQIARAKFEECGRTGHVFEMGELDCVLCGGTYCAVHGHDWIGQVPYCAVCGENQPRAKWHHPILDGKAPIQDVQDIRPGHTFKRDGQVFKVEKVDLDGTITVRATPSPGGNQ